MRKLVLATVVTATLVAAMGLAACAGGGSSASSAATSSSSASAASSSSASASASSSSASSSASSSSSAVASSASSSSSAASQSASSSAAATKSPAPVVGANGKEQATGTVVTTTYEQRAAEVGYAGSDYVGDAGLLTLLVLDDPIEVTAYKGGSDYTGEASVLCLPNDEMFRQFSGKEITIEVDSWGEWPADVSGMLYDLVLDFDADGLDLVE